MVEWHHRLDGHESWWWTERPGSCWWTGRRGMPQSMGSQRVRHDWATELIADLQCFISFKCTAKWISYTNTYTNTHTHLWGFPGGTSVKEPTCLCWRHKRCGFDSPGGGHGNQLQYSCLENPTARGVWLAAVHRVAKSQTQLKQLSTHGYICIFRFFSLINNCKILTIIPCTIW